MKPMLMMALCCATLLPTLPASAQSLWRCGPDGRTFTDRPCADGQALTGAAAPSLQAAAEAQAVAARERAALRTLAAERQARHAQARQAGWGAAGIRPEPPAEGASAPAKRKARKTGPHTASAPRPAPGGD